jgi:hypothetical protein
MSDERQQSMAFLVLNIGICLWVSHEFFERFQTIPGSIDLRHWFKFWNKPLIIHWPSAVVLFICSNLVAKRIRQRMSISSLRRQKAEALCLKKHLNPSEKAEPHEPIL